MKKVQVIAFYLPQFHPIPENDKWWGKGFTEWTSVAKAKPLFRGHIQPKIPADLGFYDLGVKETRSLQADYAKRAGVSAFCYWHYWFEGKELMERPFKEVLECGEPDFPFCLAWANHSWLDKGWTTSNKRVELKPKMLIEQTYGGEDDYTAHFYSLLPAFKDKRYYKVHGKLLFMIYAADLIPDLERFIKTWRNLAPKENLPGFYFVTHVDRIDLFPKIDSLIARGLDAVNLSYLHVPFQSGIIKYLNRFKTFNYLYTRWQNHVHFSPDVVEYKKAIKYLDSEMFSRSNIIPTIIPNWDHTPRSGRFGRVYQNCTPALFKKHVKAVFARIMNKPEDDRIVFLKSWNEWGEGNYMEPDTIHHCGYIDALHECVSNEEK